MTMTMNMTMTNTNFSYIIPFNQKTDDIFLLRKVFEWLKMFKNIEIIVVEYYDYENEKSPILSEISYPFKHIPVKTDGSLFSPSWAYNIAAKRSKSDIIIFGNSTTITKPENLKAAISLIKNKQYDMVKPFSIEISISPHHLSSFKKMETEITSPIKGKDDDNYTHLCSGITVYDRISLIKIGGWEEKFKMECYYDFQSYKTRILLNHTKLDGKGFSFNSKSPHNTQIVSSDVNINNELKSTIKENLINYVKSTPNGELNKFY